MSNRFQPGKLYKLKDRHDKIILNVNELDLYEFLFIYPRKHGPAASNLVVQKLKIGEIYMFVKDFTYSTSDSYNSGETVCSFLIRDEILYVGKHFNKKRLTGQGNQHSSIFELFTRVQ